MPILGIDDSSDSVLRNGVRGVIDTVRFDRRFVKRLLASVAALGVLGLPAGHVDAQKPGQITGTIDAVTPAAPVYGDSISFDITLVPTHHRKEPEAFLDELYVTVWCTQDGKLVYRWSASTSFAFPLIDQVAYQWDGGAAECGATLVHWYEPSFKHITYEVLDEFYFTVQPAP